MFDVILAFENLEPLKVVVASGKTMKRRQLNLCDHTGRLKFTLYENAKNFFADLAPTDVVAIRTAIKKLYGGHCDTSGSCTTILIKHAGLNVFAPVVPANGAVRTTEERTSSALALMTRNFCYMEDGVNDVFRDALVEPWDAVRPMDPFNRNAAVLGAAAAPGAVGVVGQANRANNPITTAQAKAIIENFVAKDIVKTESSRGSSLVAVMYVAIASRGHVTADKLEKVLKGIAEDVKGPVVKQITESVVHNLYVRYWNQLQADVLIPYLRATVPDHCIRL